MASSRKAQISTWDGHCWQPLQLHLAKAGSLHGGGSKKCLVPSLNFSLFLGNESRYQVDSVLDIGARHGLALAPPVLLAPALYSGT